MLIKQFQVGLFLAILVNNVHLRQQKRKRKEKKGNQREVVFDFYFSHSPKEQRKRTVYMMSASAALHIIIVWPRRPTLTHHCSATTHWAQTSDSVPAAAG